MERVFEEPGAERVCALAARSGRQERCTADCPLWEFGQCSLEALSGAGVDLDAWPEDDGPDPPPVAPLVVPPPS